MTTDRAVSWVDGVLSRDPRVSVLDAGFTSGRGVFETLSVIDQVALRLERHLDRLALSAPRLGIDLPERAAVHAGVQAVLSGWGPAPGRLRITLTAGTDRPTLAITLAPAPPPVTAMKVVTAPWVRNERSPLAGIKSTSYAENLLTLGWAHQRGADEALLADTRGYLSEGTFTNVFVVLEGRVLTPALACGCLPGIMRALVLEASAAAGCPAQEAELPLAVLAQAEEVFLTNSLRGVIPVGSLDGRPLPVLGRRTTEIQHQISAMPDSSTQ